MRFLIITLLIVFNSCILPNKQNTEFESCSIKEVTTNAFNYLTEEIPEIQIFNKHVNSVKNGIVISIIENGKAKVFKYELDESESSDFVDIINGNELVVDASRMSRLKKVVKDDNSDLDLKNYYVQCDKRTFHYKAYLYIVKQKDKTVLRYITFGDLMLNLDNNESNMLDKSIKINDVIYNCLR